MAPRLSVVVHLQNDQMKLVLMAVLCKGHFFYAVTFILTFIVYLTRKLTATLCTYLACYITGVEEALLSTISALQRTREHRKYHWHD